MAKKAELLNAPRAGVASIEARQLADYMRAHEDRELLYQDLSKVIGVNVQAKGRTYLLTARNILLRDNGIVYRPLRNIGLVRLTHAEVATLEDRETHIRRTAKKNLLERKTVDLDEVPEDQRMGYVAKVTLATLTVHVYSGKEIKRLEDALPKKQEELTLVQTLEALKGLT